MTTTPDERPLEMMRMARAWLAVALDCTVDELPPDATYEIAIDVDGRVHLQAALPGSIEAIACRVKVGGGT